MVRNAYEKELQSLKLAAVKMSLFAVEMIKNSIDALLSRDFSQALAVIESDKELDNIERDIERKCLNLFVRQQPVAADFREVSAILKMITDLERIGDQAADIAEIFLSINEKEGFIKELNDIPKMADNAINMVQESMRAFIEKDLSAARKVIASDDIVDGLFEMVTSELVELIRADKENAFQAISLMMIAKYLERIADHATNLAEWVIYYLTGIKP